MISVEEARRIILGNIRPLRETEAEEMCSCLGRVLAVDIKSKENIPPFSNSAMDGFAVRARDLAGARREKPEILEVIESLPAGYAAKRSVGAMQAIRIMTGAPLPKGADSVVMVEDTKKVIRASGQQGASQAKEWVEIFKEVEKGENVRYAGEDVKKGEIVIKKGTVLKSGHIGLLASLGLAKIKVFRKPRVAILATGDELVEMDKRLSPGKIRNSNAYSLYGQVIKMSAVPVLLGIARDNKKDLEGKIRKGLSSDMLLVSGGVSVGDYDFVKDVLKDLGTRMKFWRVAMKPGKPLAFGLMGNIPVFGLPGNPVSSMVSFEQFVRPALLKMAGSGELFRLRLWATAKEDFEKKKGLRYFLRVILENKQGQLYASLTGPQGSGILKSMAMANGIMELPEDMDVLRKGEKAQVTCLD